MYPFKKPSLWSIAFAPSTDGLQWAVIENVSTGPVLRALGKDLSGKEALDKVQSLPRDRVYISSVFPSLPTLCRSLDLPKIKKSELKPALLDVLDQSTSFNMDENSFCYESNKKTDGSWSIVSYVIQKKILEEHLSLMSKYSIEPEHVFPKATCLCAYIFHFLLHDWQYIIDVGCDETTIVLSYNGKVVESSSILSGYSIFQNLTDPNTASDNPLHQLLQRLREITAAYKDRYDLSDEVPLTVTGDIYHNLAAISAIAESISAPLSDLHTVKNQSSSTVLQCAVAIGAAFLSSQSSQDFSIPDFHGDGFTFSQPLLHWKKPLLFLFVASIFLAGSLIWYGSTQASKVAQEVQSNWLHITKDAHTTPENILKEAEHGGDSFGEDMNAPESIVLQGEWLLNTLEKNAIFPLSPNTPSLSDFLTWIFLQIEEVKKMEGVSREPISLESLHYILASRPSKTHPQEHYHVRIECEFGTQSAVAARELHNRFISPNQFIDTSTDVKWSGSNNKYKAIFLLKDKTIYPPKES